GAAVWVWRGRGPGGRLAGAPPPRPGCARPRSAPDRERALPRPATRGVHERQPRELDPVPLDDEGHRVGIPPRERLAGVLVRGLVLHLELRIRPPPHQPAPRRRAPA